MLNSADSPPRHRLAPGGGGGGVTALVGGGAHPESPRRDRNTVRDDPPHVYPRVPRPSGNRGHALQPCRWIRYRDPLQCPDTTHPAHPPPPPPTHRILLIGGGARSEAVIHIAAEVFSVPVVVPEPGEYVALGAARQAAWVVSGLLPDWPIAVAATPPVATVPTIRPQYPARAEH